MATVSEITSRLRLLIKQHTDDSPYTDEYLYSLANSAKSILLRRRATSFNKLPNPQCFCIELIESNSHDCKCIPIGCIVLKTKYPIPDTIYGRNSDLIHIKTLGELEIPIIDFRELSYRNLDPIKSNTIVATEYNRHFLIWNTLDLKAIITCANWADIADWEDKILCQDLNVEDCFDVKTLDFNLPKDLELPLFELCLKELGFSLQIKEDMTNDSNENLKY